MIEVSVNHLLLQMESNRFMLSIMRFCTIRHAFTAIWPIYTVPTTPRNSTAELSCVGFVGVNWPTDNVVLQNILRPS